MKDLTEYESELRDAVAARLLAAIAPSVQGPQSLRTALPGIWDTAEAFVAARRVVLAADAAENEEPTALLVKS
jgi:hypothetical protein